MNVFAPALAASGIAAGFGASALEQAKPDMPGWVLPAASIGVGGALGAAGFVAGLGDLLNHGSQARLGAAGILAGAGIGVALGGLIGAYVGAKRD